MRKFIIPTLVIALLFLTACQQQQQQTTKGAYVGGTQGLLAAFEAFGVEENSIYSIFDEEAFPLELTLQNKGEYAVQPGEVTVKLLGPSQEEFSGLKAWELKNNQPLEGISELVPDGGEETLSFASDAKYAKEVSGLVEREWFANIEYHYQTYLLIPEVCLKEDLQDQRVCNVKEPKKYFVSGAPITVKTVEEDTAGKGIVALKILVSNVGASTAKVTKPGEDFGVRNVLSYSLDDPAWECKSAGKLNEARLDDGRAEIVCKLKQPLADGHVSTKQVKLTLDYKYRELISEKLRIKQSS
ncbi:MAG: hypothetical protein Q8R47_03275 [Nanoarchaeota archaeon]|nr:hypothetical protein [Nanoarchaeota archaeon]